MARWVGLTALLWTLGCGDSGGDGEGSDSGASGDSESADESGETEEDTGPPADPGEFSFLTYNVAGLPDGLSSSDPVNHMPQISPLLNAFDIVLVQEDFWYHTELSADVSHPHQSAPFSEMPTLDAIGDGLNRFSIHPFEPVERVGWYSCNGTLDCASDCLATKGWSFSRTTVADGVEIDIYNLHMEAGGCPEDIVIRTQSALDLVAAIEERSEGRAVIVAGDFNLRRTDPEDVPVLDSIIDGAGLTDACDVLACGDERIDKIMVRNSDDLDIEVLEWWVPPEFTDTEDDGPLSDHLPVAAQLRYVPK